MPFGLWYTVSTQSSGTVSIDSFGSITPGQINILSGSCGSLTCVDSAYSESVYDDFGISFDTTAGTTYYVTVSSVLDGEFVLHVISPDGPPPGNLVNESGISTLITLASLILLVISLLI